MNKPLLFLSLHLALAAPLIATSATDENFIDRHASNNVEWNSWDKSKPAEATQLNRPLFFFVGHFGNSLTRAMANETFANQTIAKMVNDTTVPVAVDINQSPELAAFLFQLAETNFEASDWPICIWTTSNLAPLAGGGYFPPTDDWGGQGFLSLGRNVHEQWESEKENYVASAKERLERARVQSSKSLSPDQLLKTAIEYALIPQPDVQALNASKMNALASDATSQTQLSEQIDSIILSAGFDSIAGGFFIGSNDPEWKLPLFQKSLSDQALMLKTLTKLNGSSPNDGYSNAIGLTTNFIEQTLAKPNGLYKQYLDSFAPDETMDSIEGSHYLLAAEDFSDIPAAAIELWGLNKEGNLDENTDILGIFEGLNVPLNSSWKTLEKSSDKARGSLVELRSKKPTPASDEIGYTASNALIAQAFAQTKNKAMLQKAIALLDAIEAANFDKASGQFFNSDAKTHPASSQAYANLIAAYLDTFEATKKAKFKKKAIALQKSWAKDSRFKSDNPCSLKISDDIHFSITRDLDIPSSVSTQLANLRKLGKITGNKSYSDQAAKLAEQLPSGAERDPDNYISMLQNLAN